ncbi:hypothetical protein [Cellulomonas cellasea]|nr:hypothetical protein [Cellulomonas cellasea]
MTLVVVAAVGLGMAASPAGATPPRHVPDGSATGVGALPVDSSIGAMPVQVFPAAPRSTSGCTFPAVTTPGGQLIRHVAPCGSATGTGAPTSPWRSVAQAMASLQPGDVAYLHDDPALAIDYQESGLRPARSGTGESARIRLMAAPGERPWLGRSPSASSETPLVHLDRSWWVLEGLNLDAAGLTLRTSVLRIGTARATSVHHDVVRGLSARNTGGTKAVVEFDGAENSALLDSAGPAAGGGRIGLIEPLGTDDRPMGVPAAGSRDFTDHHAVTAKNGADRILVRNVESAGHNGDSFQCGEESGTTRPVTSNVTLVGNRFHHEEENAVDLKACHGVTLRDTKMYGFRPARPSEKDGTLSTRAPQGDAVVMHAAESGRSADRVLVELNRFWDNSRAVNVSNRVARVVVRRNLVFAASTAACGIGAGMDVRAADAEVYGNTLEGLLSPTAAPAACGTRFSWSGSQRAAIRLAGATSSRAVLWNNIVSNASVPYASTSGLVVDARRNLFDAAFPGMPPDSRTGNPRFVTDPANNDYFTERGSPARDEAAGLPSAVRDPRQYCDDPSATEPDTLVEPDIGFLESCS